MRPEQNGFLRQLLGEAGLTPRGLGNAINHLVGPGTVSPTAPYHWVARGGIPRSPLPGIVAQLLSMRLNRQVAPSDIWPGRPRCRRPQGSVASHGRL